MQTVCRDTGALIHLDPTGEKGKLITTYILCIRNHRPGYKGKKLDKSQNTDC